MPTRETSTPEPATAEPAAVGQAEMLLGQLVERWAPELRRTRCHGRVRVLLDWLGGFKLCWDPMEELEPFVRVRDPSRPGGVATVLSTDFMGCVDRCATEHNVDPLQVLADATYHQLLISAGDVALFCRKYGFRPPSFWPETHAHAQGFTADSVADRMKRVQEINALADALNQASAADLNATITAAIAIPESDSSSSTIKPPSPKPSRRKPPGPVSKAQAWLDAFRLAEPEIPWHTNPSLPSLFDVVRAKVPAEVRAKARGRGFSSQRMCHHLREAYEERRQKLT